MDKDIVAMFNGTVLVNVHTVDQCNGEPCVIHNPSNHHMFTWKPSWDDALGIMFRRCTHGNLHPDPDNVNYLRRVNKTHYATHVCDGCCQPSLDMFLSPNQGGTPCDTKALPTQPEP